ncbi:LOW QUALITY PROTEIN: hypothetical protein CVT26_008262 [Gymnopilus dilepis]|uniref:Retrovirus-related Pol polyprotein from transposon TNT 1-94-like beta-barrel domain-containing protein n=1 Tax=Gymnopilus dilepis TaxID=231916 RepID=A0A409YFQ9_9AGAR|nr:LOW QUALITY PROTEIN: hypothetical protein CVT26_008262 [Gymnopilus dilepis]
MYRSLSVWASVRPRTAGGNLSYESWESNPKNSGESHGSLKAISESLFMETPTRFPETSSASHKTSSASHGTPSASHEIPRNIMESLGIPGPKGVPWVPGGDSKPPERSGERLKRLRSSSPVAEKVAGALNRLEGEVSVGLIESTTGHDAMSALDTHFGFPCVTTTEDPLCSHPRKPCCAPEVMGPADLNMSNQSNLKLVNLLKLHEDGSNWVTYKERVLNHLTSKGLIRHVKGTVKQPLHLTDNEMEAHEQQMDIFEQKQAQVREVIYEMTSKSVFLEIKDEPTAEKLWTKLVDIHESKGTMVYTDTLAKLSGMRYIDGKSMHVHISTMKELRERLTEMGSPISDDQFSAYIQASLTPDYRRLLTSITASSRTSGRSIQLSDLIQFIYEEADNKATKKNVDDAKENSGSADTSPLSNDVDEPAAMVITTSEGRGKILNCRATNHFTSERSALINFREITPVPINAANDNSFRATSRGDMRIELPNSQAPATTLTLQNVYYAENMAYTLVSITCLVNAQFTVSFSGLHHQVTWT